MSPAALRVRLTPSAGGKKVTVMSITIAAKAPVTKNTKTSDFITFPSRSIEDIVATALQIVENTKGTTTINIALIKISPRGLNIRASFPIITPRIHPIPMPIIRIIGKKYDSSKPFPLTIIKSPPIVC